MRMTIKNALLSYAHLSQPQAGDFDDKPKYSAALLLRKDDPQAAALHKACVDLARQRWPDRALDSLRLPLRDGDEKDDEMYKGRVYVNARSARRPVFLNRAKEQASQEEIDAEAQSGMFCHVAVGLYCYSVSGNNGVGVGLNAVMTTGEGDPITGGGVDDFAGIEAAPAPQVRASFEDIKANAPAAAAPYPFGKTQGEDIPF